MSLHFFTASINKALKVVNLELHRPSFVVFLVSALVKKKKNQKPKQNPTSRRTTIREDNGK